MNETEHESHYTENVQEHLHKVQSLLEKHALVESLAHRQQMPRDERHVLVESLLHKQHLRALREKLDTLHSADIAYILEALPIEQRLLVWELVRAERDGEILIEVSDAVRQQMLVQQQLRELANLYQYM